MKFVHAELHATMVTLGPVERVVHVFPDPSVEKYNLAAELLLTMKRVQLISHAT
jgi:hypothetical protein